MKIAIDLIRQGDGQSRVAPGFVEPFGGQRGITIVIQDEINMAVQARGVQRIDHRREPGLGTVESGLARIAKIKSIVDIIANAKVTGVTAAGWWRPDSTVTGHEKIRSALFDGVVGRFEPLQDGRSRDIGQQSAVFQFFQ